MKILILHLSDIHITGETDVILKRPSKIKNAIANIESDVEICFVVISGDIAFSGNQSEYSVAIDFLVELEDSISKIDAIGNVELIIIPGNHDCNVLEKEDEVRTILIDDINKNPERSLDKSIINQCVNVQNDFFDFLETIDKKNIADGDSRLFYDKEFTLNGYELRFNCYNTAWMSRKPERQGRLLFPLDRIKENKNKCDLIVSVFHHPYNWLQPDNARLFRQYIEHTSDIILTGHEHDIAKYTKQELNGQISEYLEGGVLQESHSEDNSSFNVVLIDLENRLQKIHQYIWDENFYNCSQESDQWEDFQRSKFLLKQEFGIDNKFQQYLCDAGANFTHPRKDPLLLSDIYVYPNFRDLEIDSNADTLSFTMIEGKNLVSYALAANHLVIAGPEQSGKTALAKTLFLEFHQKGFIPVLLTGDSLTKFKEEKILKEIYDKFIKQYSSDLLEKYKQLEKEKRVLLIDDFHHIKANKKGKNRILDVLIKRFGKVIILGNDLFRLEEFIYQKEEENLQLNFKHLELKEFGYLLREKIIEKWYLMGQEYSIDEGEITHKILQAHNMVDTILGNNLLPSFPIFILIILQQIEANTPLNTTTGSFGYFYEVLITKALASTSREIDLDTKYNYLSELAYKMLTSKTRKMTESEMRNFHDYYCLEYIEIPYAKLIDDLVEASIFDFLDNYYRFKYKFIYYYFVARYLRDNITEKEIKKIIVSISKKIYNEEFANILIFLCYLSKDPFIINEILKNAKEVYKEESPCDLEKNIMFLNKMYKKLPQVILLATDPKRNREALLKERDEIEENQEKTQADKDEVEDYDLKDRLLQNRGREALD